MQKEISNLELQNRVQKIQQKMAELNTDIIFVYGEANRFYLTNFNCSNAIIVIDTKALPRFYTDARYLESAKSFIANFEVLDIKNFESDAEKLNASNISAISVENTISAHTYLSLKSKIKFEIKLDADKIFNEIRTIKSKTEIEIIRDAVLLADQIFDHELQNFKFDITENQLHKNIEIAALKAADGTSFNTIVCFGENTAYPHYTPQNFKLKNNMPICIDMGVKIQHYCSDMTRTFFYGEPHQKLIEFYEIVSNTVCACKEFIKPGITCQELDALSRKIIGDAGYAELFAHGLGHGVGLNIHEFPLLSRDKDCVLKEGMVFTLEPGIYMPGIGGVRIEDIVAVTETGCQVLTTSPKQLLIL